VKLSDTGLRMQPFQTHGKPAVVVPYTSQQAALQFFHEVRSSRHGLGLFLGPPFSGKTSVIWQFTRLLGPDYPVAVIDGACKDAAALLQDILEQFGFDQGLDTVNERFAMVRVFVTQKTASVEAPLLIVENADAMRPLTLELLCELAELEVRGKSALRIMLASSKPMSRMLAAPAMEPMSKRVTGRFLLQPLTREETGTYVYRKLQHGGCKNPQYLVPRTVCDRMHAASGGWPGMVDQLAMTAIANAEHFPLRIEHVPNIAGPKPEAVKRPVAPPQLILTHRHETLRRVNLSHTRLLIGRNELCDLHIDDEWVSRHHAVLFRNGQGTILIDLKSRNGIYVNGQRATRQLLVNNDIIALGAHRIKFIDPSARQRTTLQSAGWDETTISKSIKEFRNVLAQQLQAGQAS